MVTRLLRLADPPRPADAADALALAICHIWRGGARRGCDRAAGAAGEPAAAAARRRTDSRGGARDRASGRDGQRRSPRTAP